MGDEYSLAIKGLHRRYSRNIHTNIDPLHNRVFSIQVGPQLPDNQDDIAAFSNFKNSFDNNMFSLKNEKYQGRYIGSGCGFNAMW